MNVLGLLVVGVHIFICTFVVVDGNSDCTLISNTRHQVSAKDFKVTSIHQKYVMCGAYFCSHSLSVLPLQLLIHEINSTKSSLAIYLEKSSITIDNCGFCQVDDLQKAEKESSKCEVCPNLEPSKTVDIYVRLEKPSDFNSSNDECSFDVNFNMTVQEYTCEIGLTTNIPQINECNISTISSSDLHCITPTCSKNIITKNDTDNFIHTFIPSNSSEICIWDLFLEPMKTVDITFSPAIKNHLTIYEGKLLNPKWNLKACDHVTDNMKMNTTAAKNIFILYKNDGTLSIESFLKVNITTERCSFPPDLKNGIVEIKGSGSETVAHYTCFEKYRLIGSQQVNCFSERSDSPECIIDKEKFMADGPNFSTEQVDLLTVPFEGTLNMSVVIPSQTPGTPSNKTLMDNRKFSPKVESGDAEATRSNISLIELDTGTSDSVKLSTDTTTFTNSLVEGSGGRLEDEDGYSDDTDTEAPENTSLEGGTDDLQLSNTSISGNDSMGPPWHSAEGGLVLFSLPSLEDKLMLLILIGVGILLFSIVTVTCLIVCRNRSIRSGLNRKFDTFQNPIYEKPVIRVPIPNSDSDPSHEKLDLGDLSDSTVLD